jgi:hypothetical protein
LARYISPLAALPGYRHTIGVARSWHFLNVYGFIITGLIFVSLLFGTTQWQRLVPTSGTVFVQAWSTFVHYANFHFPPEPNGYYGYNALQQLTYFGMVFVMGPLSIATGLAMSPALVNHFSRFGGRQSRSIHFVAMLGCVRIVVTALGDDGIHAKRYIVIGTDDHTPLGDPGSSALAWCCAGFYPRSEQLDACISADLFTSAARDLQSSREPQRYRIDSRHFWPNGKMPCARLERLAADHSRCSCRWVVSSSTPWRCRSRSCKPWAWKRSSPCTTASRAGPASRNGRACR